MTTPCLSFVRDDDNAHILLDRSSWLQTPREVEDSAWELASQPFGTRGLYGRRFGRESKGILDHLFAKFFGDDVSSSPAGQFVLAQVTLKHF
jgi:hypothetical protein